jgi:DAACS family dicarboxylate/amino acid:cation (Na+ or H+) symporter
MKRLQTSLPTLIIAGMLLGLAVGYLVGSRVAPLGVVGKVYIDLIKMMAIPLVFLSIIDAIISTSISWRSAGRWGLVILCNTTCALVIGLVLSNLFQPGRGFPSSLAGNTGQAPTEVQPPSLGTMLDAVVPNSIIQPFAENNVISVVFLSILLGAALRRFMHEQGLPHAQAQRFVQGVLSVWSIALMWLVHLVPIAVFCVTAKTVGESGFSPFANLAKYVGLGFLGLMLQIVIVYPLWIRLKGGIPIRTFLQYARKPMVYAFGTNSSLATLPLTLNALDELKVSKSASRLGACIGTNFNNDGILLYEAMAVLFVAQAYGIDLSLGQQVMAALMSLVAAIGVAGVPEAGVVSLSLVLTAVGLPLEVVPLLLTVDWLVARMRSVTNVLSDMTVSIAISDPRTA